jgi:hypothetical protein
MKPLVFVAVEPSAARTLRDTGAPPDGVAYAATPALRESFGYGADADEDADYAAQLFASLAGALAGWDRCVLAVATPTLPPSRGAADYGQVDLPKLRWADVQAVFVDEPEALPAVRAYAESVRSGGIAEVWADPATHEFVASHDLLWFAPGELDQALASRSITKGD